MKLVSKAVVIASLLAAPAMVLACGMEKAKTAESPPAKPAVARVEKGEKAQPKAVEPKAAKPDAKATAQN